MSDKQASGNDQPDRTDLAEDRTILANERTYAGWIRTALTALAVALGLRALMRSFEPVWVPQLISSAFVVVAIALIWLAWRRARHVQSRLDMHAIEGMPRTPMGWITGLMIVASLALGVVLWLVA